LSENEVRAVFATDIVRASSVADAPSIDAYLADRVPSFYRSPDVIAKRLQEGYMLTAVREALQALPTSESFQESHFAEIVASIVAEELLGLRVLYHKLRLNTSENSNPNKIDLVLYDPSKDPIELVLGEVKSSMKTAVPASHDKSCFADLFNSMNKYSDTDKNFDLAAANAHLSRLPERDRELVRVALAPYSNAKTRYAGFTVIDARTRDDDELTVLATRKNTKQFEVDVLCVETLGELAKSVYERLERVRTSV
jgi:hypothetical protein